MHTKQYSNYLWLVTAVAAAGGLLFGFDMAVVSGVLPFVRQQFSLSALQEGWFVSVALVGCMVGVAFSGELSDRQGRKKTLLLSALFFLLSAIGCTALPSLSWIMAARLVGGIGVGIASNVVPLYIAEIAPAAIRGRLVTCYQLAITTGILLAYLTNALLLHCATQAQGSMAGNFFHFIYVTEIWRGMFSIGTLPALLFLLGICFVPESPRWLPQQQRSNEAKAILQRMTTSHANAAAELMLMQQNGSSRKGSYAALRAPALRKALVLGLLLPFFSQFSGINAIIYYGPGILNSAGISMNDSLVSQVLLGAANLLFTLIAIWKVDSMGRRPLYIAGTIGAAISLFLTGWCFYKGYTGSIALLLAVLLFLACFAFSIGPLKFVVASEIFPNHIRGRAMALSIMVMWMADTIVGQLTPVLLRSIGTAYTFWFFSFFCLLAFGIIVKLLPETKGQSLEQIEHSWHKN